MSKLDLLSRLRKAETGSPELSAEVFKALNPEYKDLYLYYHNSIGLMESGYYLGESDDRTLIKLPPLTQSIDAALGADKEKLIYDLNPVTNKVWSKDRGGIGCFTVQHDKSLILAICIALLEAKQ